ncbi:HisA/HisF-related TIM barrel protein [Herminiimonas arsenitoxidans]|uniref:HisA/HisF-related TIM barrel protein n=1 Tax=Herminiimonas arsenitoxidans TaxID=1809410 RepID=UPI0009710021|nr:HisA/HisF-related TIM barrel protein [Herminiimonas arsenitoxidans]
MLKKRLVGIVTVKNGWAVQSFGYRRYLPLGKPECLIENLDRWGADEILVQVIDRSVSSLGPDFKLLERLGALGLETPLIYSGGIRSVSDGIKVVQSGADRISVDALLHSDLSSVKDLSERLGAQALIASLPLSFQTGGLEWLDYRFRTSKPIPDEIFSLIQNGIVSEVLISDWQHEGLPGGFEQKLVQEFPLKNVPIIAFGGISEHEQMRTLLKSTNVAALAVGNFLSYKEHAIQKYKEALTGLPLRLATYESMFPLIANV